MQLTFVDRRGVFVIGQRIFLLALIGFDRLDKRLNGLAVKIRELVQSGLWHILSSQISYRYEDSQSCKE